MSFWAVVFVVLMILWLFGGCYTTYDPSKGAVSLGGTLLPWCCVAILGAIILGGLK